MGGFGSPFCTGCGGYAASVISVGTGEDRRGTGAVGPSATGQWFRNWEQEVHMCIRSGGWLSCGPEVRLRGARRCWGKASVCVRVKKVRRVAGCCTFPKTRESPMHFN